MTNKSRDDHVSHRQTQTAPGFAELQGSKWTTSVSGADCPFRVPRRHQLFRTFSGGAAGLSSLQQAGSVH